MGSAFYPFRGCYVTRLPDEGDEVERFCAPLRHQDLSAKSIRTTVSSLAARYDGQDVRNQRTQRRSDYEVSA